VSESSSEVRGYRQGAAALTLRLAGASYADIAEALELGSSVQARALVVTTLAARAPDAEEREHLRAEEAGRLERLLRGVWGKANDPNHAEHLPAIKVALALIDRHIRLYGLDAPAQVVVHNPTVAEIDAWVAQVMAVQVGERASLGADVAGMLGP
jgi:hypothetical protein